MQGEPRQLLSRLLETPGTSGYEQPVQKVVREYVEPFADQVTTDVHGSVVAATNLAGQPRLMLDGHCDQIGLLVTQIDDDGYLYSQPIGGWDPQQLVGQRMTIWTDSGPLPAVIARKPIHLQNDQEKKAVVKQQELWLDLGARDKQDAADRVRIGDPVTLQLGSAELANRLVCGPALDNRSGLWVVIEALRLAAERPLEAAVFAASTVQEEIGLRGAKTSAYTIDPQVGIAVDVTHATDCPTIDKRQQGEVRLGKGPVIFRGPNMNPRVVTRLLELCQEYDLPYQMAAIGRASPNDANTIQVSRGGVAAGLVSIPCRYMHSAVETVSLDDLDHAAQLLAHFATSLRATDDFTP